MGSQTVLKALYRNLAQVTRAFLHVTHCCSCTYCDLLVSELSFGVRCLFPDIWLPVCNALEALDAIGQAMSSCLCLGMG